MRLVPITSCTDRSFNWINVPSAIRPWLVHNSALSIGYHHQGPVAMTRVPVATRICIRFLGTHPCLNSFQSFSWSLNWRYRSQTICPPNRFVSHSWCSGDPVLDPSAISCQFAASAFCRCCPVELTARPYKTLSRMHFSRQSLISEDRSWLDIVMPYINGMYHGDDGIIVPMMLWTIHYRSDYMKRRISHHSYLRRLPYFQWIQVSLIFMLSYVGNVPIDHWGNARLPTHQAPLHETGDCSFSDKSRNAWASRSSFLSPNNPIRLIIIQAEGIATAHKAKFRYTLPTAAMTEILLRPYWKPKVSI